MTRQSNEWEKILAFAARKIDWVVVVNCGQSRLSVTEGVNQRSHVGSKVRVGCVVRPSFNASALDSKATVTRRELPTKQSVVPSKNSFVEDALPCLASFADVTAAG